MAFFKYSARDARGGRVEGALETQDLRSLADALAGQGLTLVKAQERNSDVSESTAGSLFQRPVNTQDLLLFCRQMATLLKAGVPILRALNGLQESATHAGFGRVLASLQQSLSSGRDLSSAMQRERAVFTPYMTSMIRVGETTGQLPQIFEGLFVQLGFERESREQIKGALRYPMFVIATAIAAVIAVNILVIPAFSKVYESMHADLPVFTVVLIATSHFMIQQWPLLLGATTGSAVAVVMYLRSEPGQDFKDALLLRLPVFGELVRKSSLARFCKSFGLALNAGVSMVDALQVAVATTGNRALASRIGEMRNTMERGESMVRSARATGVFPPTVLQMIGVGEETGALGDMMNEVANLYQRDVEFAIKGIAAQIEPIMIVILGGLVLVIALGVFLPMWDMSRVMLHH